MVNTFMNDPVDGTKCTLSKFADDIKLGGAADGPMGLLSNQWAATGWRNWYLKTVMAVMISKALGVRFFCKHVLLSFFLFLLPFNLVNFLIMG